MSLLARDIMTPNVIHLERGSSVFQAASNMTHNRVGCLIVTAGGFPVGILTETDIVHFIANGRDPRTTRIEDIMSSPLYSTTSETDLVQIANTMSANKIKKMPVIDRQRILGIITQTDIVHCSLRIVANLQQQHDQGRITSKEFTDRASEFFLSMPSIVEGTKHWHMRCRSCGFRFLADEVNGKLAIQSCPRCNGEIIYDQLPQT